MEPKTVWRVAAVVVAALVVGVAAGRGTASSATVTKTVTKTVEVPAKSSDGAGGLAAERTPAGARSVARDYIGVSQALGYSTADSDDELLDGVLASGAVSERARQLQGVEDIRESVTAGRRKEPNGRWWWVFSPLATAVRDFSKERATVQVWALNVQSQDGWKRPVGAYVTVTVELVWEDGRWRVFSSQAAPGPTVSPTSDTPVVDSAVLDRRLDGFDPAGLEADR
jgi:hypothetical protein